MSGVCGLFNLDGAPVEAGELGSMGSLLARRGPDGSGSWHAGAVGLGYALLATTPEALLERLPLEDAASGCVITADVRLDNRAELLDALGLSDRAGVMGDAGVILTAYLAWGNACVERFLGDFAFAIWDPRQRRLFCARDHFGMRPFYYHHTAGRFFAFASEPRAILVLPQTPYRINEGRIADFLVSQLEGIDKTSTFFEEVFRLPPAHMLTVTLGGVTLRRYWVLKPGPELRLASNEAYAEAFLEVFTQAVRCRLRGAGPVGAMLSGGMDSGSVVAVARQILAREGRGPLQTFSALGPDEAGCVETRTIRAALSMDGLDAHSVGSDEMDELMPELEELTWNLDEPFDGYMTLIRVVYLMARRRGLKVVLDGVAGDLVLLEGRRLARLIGAGRWLSAYREAIDQRDFWGDALFSPARELLGGVRMAFVPNSLRRWRRRLLGARRERQWVEESIRDSFLGAEFAERVDLASRMRASDEWRPVWARSNEREERVRTIDAPSLTVARERYGREAASAGIEPRDPFLDRRVVSYCLGLPSEQRMNGGWPKAILRRATGSLLPDEVRWRRGKEHLGWTFTAAFIARSMDRVREAIEEGLPFLEPYVNTDSLRKACASCLKEGDMTQVEEIFHVAHLGAWLRRHANKYLSSD